MKNFKFQKYYLMAFFLFFNTKPGLMSWLLHGNKSQTTKVIPVDDIYHKINVIRSETSDYLERINEILKNQDERIFQQKEEFLALKTESQMLSQQLNQVATNQSDLTKKIMVIQKENEKFKQYLTAAIVEIAILSCIEVIKTYKNYKKSKIKKAS